MSESIGNACAVCFKRGVFFDPKYNRKTLIAFKTQKLSVLELRKLVGF